MSQHTKPQVEAIDPLDTPNPGGTILPLLLENLGNPNARARVLAIRELSDYTDTVAIDRLIEFVGADRLNDRDAMLAAVCPELYRNKA